MNDYDVAIIGSGLGGLACGAILSKNGYKVVVLEKNKVPGGCLQTFERKGVKFETGMHYIGSMREGETLNRYFKYLSLNDQVQLNELDRNGYDVISFGGKRYPFANSIEPFIETLSRFFPKESASIRKYIRDMGEIASRSPLYSLNHFEDPYYTNEYALSTGVDDYLIELTDNQILRNVLTGIMPLYGGRKDVTPLYYHAIIADFYNRSAFRIVGGSDRIASSLCTSVREAGGEIITEARVEKIICNQNRASRITLCSGETLSASHFISAIHPALLMDMIDTPLIRKSYRKRVRSIPQTDSNFTVYIKFRELTVPYMNYNFFHYPGQSVWESPYFFYMHLCREKNQRMAHGAILYENMRWEEVERWKDLPCGNRGQEYEDFKTIRAEKLLSALEKQFPGTVCNIENYWTSTPLTYNYYTGTPQGAMFGIMRNKNDLRGISIMQRTKVPNLYLAGQNINAHGIMGVIIGSVLTCAEIMGIEPLLKQIQNT